MSGLLEVSVGVAAGRGVATADVPADQTLTQRHPAQSGVNAALADVTAGLYFGIRLFQVLTFRHKTSVRTTALDDNDGAQDSRQAASIAKIRHHRSRASACL
jgi:hypothetical protein